jgi:hypothetical protein
MYEPPNLPHRRDASDADHVQHLTDPVYGQELLVPWYQPNKEVLSH